MVAGLVLGDELCELGLQLTLAAGADQTAPYAMTGETGSYRYMAPEVMNENENYTAKVDVYSPIIT